MNLPDRKLVNPPLCNGDSLCLFDLGFRHNFDIIFQITPNCRQSMGSVQYSAVFSLRFTLAAVPRQPPDFDGVDYAQYL